MSKKQEAYYAYVGYLHPSKLLMSNHISNFQITFVHISCGPCQKRWISHLATKFSFEDA